MRKIFITFFIMCFILTSISAREIIQHNTDVSLDEKGNARIMEEFTVNLNGSEEINLFEQISKIAKNDISAWKNFMPEIDAYVIGEKKDIIITSEVNLKFGSKIKIEYSIDSFASSIEGPRTTTKTVEMSQFEYMKNGQLILPPKTALILRIKLTKTIDLLEKKPTPDSEIIEGQIIHSCIQGGNMIYKWNGPLITNDFRVVYRTEKPIGESWNLEEIWNSIYISFTENPVYALALVIIIVLIIIYRKQIFGLISESFAGEEEVERPKKEL